MKNDIEIKRCICGKKPILKTDEIEFYLVCPNCKRHSQGMSPIGAIDGWNNLIEKEKKLIKECGL